MKFIDTNIFLRYLLWDDAKKANQCKKLFTSALENKIQLFTTELVIAEIIWTLSSFYKYPREKVAEAVLRVLSLETLHVPNKAILMEAVGLFLLKNIDFIDAYNAVVMHDKDIKSIYTYDKHFDLIKSIQRQEPS